MADFRHRLIERNLIVGGWGAEARDLPDELEGGSVDLFDFGRNCAFAQLLYGSAHNFNGIAFV